ncbi:hypothetical protein KUCAC02_035640, partial [Chaenocephalus aceratus]
YPGGPYKLICISPSRHVPDPSCSRPDELCPISSASHSWASKSGGAGHLCPDKIVRLSIVMRFDQE